MAAKALFVVCAQALLIQAALSQYLAGNSLVDNNISIGNGLSGGLGFGSGSGVILNSGLGGLTIGQSGLNGVSGLSGVSGLNGITVGQPGLNGLTIGQSGLNVVSGGPLIVTSISPIGPSGLAVASENAIEGVLTVSGQLPFLSAVAFEGSLPTSGSGVATCGCGNGEVGIVSEGLPNVPVASNQVLPGRRF